MSTTPDPQVDPPTRRVQFFEFDSLLWWKKSGVWMVGIFGVFVFLMQPCYVCRGGEKATRTEAVNNARQIGMALFEFQEQFGQMPDAGSVVKVRQKFPTELNLGTKSSNDLFRQLLASGIAQSEPMFFAKTAGSRKPDGIISGSSALAKGECGFAYFTGTTPESNPSRPVLVTPLIPGTNRFDPKQFDGKAVVLKADCSVTSLPIVKSTGRVMLNGQDLMDPANPIWGGCPPFVALPEL